MRRIKRWIFNRWAESQLKRFDNICEDPQKMYEENWAKICSMSRNETISTFGKQPPLELLRSLPLTHYSDYKDAFTQSLQTKKNPLTGEDVHFWVNSTGTTGKYKTIPISKTIRKNLREASLIRISLLIQRFDVLSAAPEIVFVLPGESQGENPALPIGVVGYYYYKNIPGFLEKNFVYSKRLYANETDFNKWHLLMALLTDASGISTPVPAKITHFLNEINAERATLLETLEADSWPKELCNHYNADRIKELKQLLRKPIHDIAEIWPSLRFVSTWQAGDSCGRQLAELRRKFNFGTTQFIDQVYNASEGIFNIPLIDEIGGPVNPFGIILEFYDTEQDRYYWPWELEPGKCYDLLVTNAMGLVRYQMQDKVQCTGYSGKLAKIAFHSRSQVEISLGWGTIEEQELERALLAADISDFSEFYFCVNSTGNGVDWVSTNKEYASKLPKVEEELARINTYYGAMRDKGILSGITFNVVSNEDFYTALARNVHSKGILIK